MKVIEIIPAIEEIIKDQTGIIIEKGRLVDLEIILHSRLIFYKMLPKDYIEFLKNNYNEIVFLASCFTIQETSFYRYKAHFDRLKLEVIPEIITKRRNANKKIQILSAGCATGEEPYTIAMILNDLIEDIDKWNIRITATDINENALKAAKEGNYSEYKLRNIDNWYINRYFTRITQNGRNSTFKINESLKNLVTFTQCNLIREPFELSALAGMDIIFCENVMIYFCMESIQRLINNFYSILRNNGYLFLGYSETLNFIEHNFSITWWNNSFAYKKSDEKVHAASTKPAELRTTNEKINHELKKMDTKSYEDLINLILRNYHEKLFDNVEILLRSIEESNIRIDEIFYLIKAEYLFDKEEYINASNESRKAINKNPHLVDGHILLGVIYLQLNMLESASFEFKTALYIDQSSILANYYYAVFQNENNNEQEYLQYLERARELLNNNRGILKNRIYPINKSTKNKIFNELLNLNNNKS